MGKKNKKYIESGDVMQVVISHEITRIFRYRTYLLLSSSSFNKSISLYEFFNLGDTFIIASSPEILVRLESEKLR